MTNPLTPTEIAALQAEHTPPEIPPCSVCGGPLGPDGSDSEFDYYACDAVSIPVSGNERVAAIRKRLKHHQESQLAIRRGDTDPRILALCAEVLAHRERETLKGED